MNKQIENNWQKFYDLDVRKQLRSDPETTLVSLGLPPEKLEGYDFIVKTNSLDRVYFVIPPNNMENLKWMSEIQAAGVVSGSAGTVSTVGTASTVGSVCESVSTVGTASSVGTAGTFACQK